MQNLRLLNDKCRQSNSSLARVLLRHARYRIAGKNIFANERTIIKGLGNIETPGMLQIGLRYVGFMHRHDRTYLNINGRLIIRGSYSIGKGCRFDIGSGAVAQFGHGYVNSNTTFVIMHGLSVGDGCAISWGCEFLDEDFHHLDYPGKKNRAPFIQIGNHVWIGSHVRVLKGSRIPDGCVVASGSVVCSAFEETNCLLAGNPARVVRTNIEWS